MKFLTAQEEAEIIAALGKAEEKSSGEIRVHLAKRCWGSPVKTAARVFARLGMTGTAERNGVLFYLALKNRKFAVIGDAGIHEKVSADFWEKIRDAMEDDFKKGDFLKGLTNGIRTCGEELARYFPRKAEDRNELSDKISHEPSGES